MHILMDCMSVHNHEFHPIQLHLSVLMLLAFLWWHHQRNPSHAGRMNLFLKQKRRNTFLVAFLSIYQPLEDIIMIQLTIWFVQRYHPMILSLICPISSCPCHSPTIHVRNLWYLSLHKITIINIAMWHFVGNWIYTFSMPLMCGHIYCKFVFIHIWNKYIFCPKPMSSAVHIH